jgi:hypothetical protein
VTRQARCRAEAIRWTRRAAEREEGGRQRSGGTLEGKDGGRPGVVEHDDDSIVGSRMSVGAEAIQEKRE